MRANGRPGEADALKMADEVKQRVGAVGFASIKIEELPLEPAPPV